jgi:hypothetical protein
VLLLDQCWKDNARRWRARRPRTVSWLPPLDHRLAQYRRAAPAWYVRTMATKVGRMSAADIKKLPSAGLGRHPLGEWIISGELVVVETYVSPTEWIQLDEKHGICRTAPRATDPMEITEFGGRGSQVPCRSSWPQKFGPVSREGMLRLVPA